MRYGRWNVGRGLDAVSLGALLAVAVAAVTVVVAVVAVADVAAIVLAAGSPK